MFVAYCMLISHLEKESGPLNVVPADSFRDTLSFSGLKVIHLIWPFQPYFIWFPCELWVIVILHHQASLKLEVMNILKCPDPEAAAKQH